MKILVDKSFERDSKRLPIQVQQQLKAILQRLAEAESIQQLDVTKMEGASNAYRLRFGNYRIGFYLETGSVVLSRVLNRRDIYRYFPRK